MEVDSTLYEDLARPRRTRFETQRTFYGQDPNAKSLELEGIVKVLQEYRDYEGGVNCSVCGKLYKSKVCFTKHLWEHSVYWDQFDGEKNQDRVLSIQAALIIYSRSQSNDNSHVLSSLLVTSPHQNDRKRDVGELPEDDGRLVASTNNDQHRSILCTPEKCRPLVTKVRTPSRYGKSPQDGSNGRRRRARSSSASIASLPASVLPTFSLSDTEMSPSKSARQM